MTVSGSNRVYRGGSWINNARNCRSAYRNNGQPGNRNDNLGFRLVSTPSGQRAGFTDPARVLQAMSRSSSSAGLAGQISLARGVW
ncbi:MAG: SUMF1/EgtB/PvdO family nonheme iron enzyme [Candidatus Tectimicrobiota bacterium]